jgi:hypothetical protein
VLFECCGPWSATGKKTVQKNPIKAAIGTKQGVDGIHATKAWTPSTHCLVMIASRMIAPAACFRLSLALLSPVVGSEPFLVSLLPSARQRCHFRPFLCCCDLRTAVLPFSCCHYLSGAAVVFLSLLLLLSKFPAGHGASSPVIDRGIALHKMIRLITMALGGEEAVTLSLSVLFVGI